MKRGLFLLVCTAAAFCADAPQVRTVYLLPMAHGLDQYVASHLTSKHVLQVVADPAKADAILTDRLGENFEEKLNELYPPPPPPPAPAAKETDEKPKDDTNTASPPGFGDTVNKLEKPGNMASWGRGRGTMFLVNSHSRAVVWSLVELPKNSTPKELDRTAARIVEKLRKDLGSE